MSLPDLLLTGSSNRTTSSTTACHPVGYTHSMVLTVDSKRRVTLPQPAHPGDAFAVETTGAGQFVLTRLEKPAHKVKLTRKHGFFVASSGRPITMAQTRALLDQK